ncbi:hypothetical protein ScalyP_jg607 [Parmales sp. scaly parma]|nr:hypothetical protein ScalyP_jg607 [Parmales sp. scaly parma]
MIFSPTTPSSTPRPPSPKLLFLTAPLPYEDQGHSCSSRLCNIRRPSAFIGYGGTMEKADWFVYNLGDVVDLLSKEEEE